jgi:hypothetical protein
MFQKHLPDQVGRSIAIFLGLWFWSSQDSGMCGCGCVALREEIIDDGDDVANNSYRRFENSVSMFRGLKETFKKGVSK